VIKSGDWRATSEDVISPFGHAPRTKNTARACAFAGCARQAISRPILVGHAGNHCSGAKRVALAGLTRILPPHLHKDTERAHFIQVQARHVQDCTKKPSSMAPRSYMPWLLSYDRTSDNSKPVIGMAWLYGR